MSWGAPVSRQPRLQTPSARVGGLRPSLSPAAAAAAAFSTALSPPSRARTPSTACPSSRARTPGSRPNSGASGSRPISRGSHPVMANTQPGQARARRAGTTDILALGSEGLGRDIDRHEFNRQAKFNSGWAGGRPIPPDADIGYHQITKMVASEETMNTFYDTWLGDVLPRSPPSKTSWKPDMRSEWEAMAGAPSPQRRARLGGTPGGRGGLVESGLGAGDRSPIFSAAGSPVTAFSNQRPGSPDSPNGVAAVSGEPTFSGSTLGKILELSQSKKVKKARENLPPLPEGSGMSLHLYLRSTTPLSLDVLVAVCTPEAVMAMDSQGLLPYQVYAQRCAARGEVKDTVFAEVLHHGGRSYAAPKLCPSSSSTTASPLSGVQGGGLSMMSSSTSAPTLSTISNGGGSNAAGGGAAAAARALDRLMTGPGSRGGGGGGGGGLKRGEGRGGDGRGGVYTVPVRGDGVRGGSRRAGSSRGGGGSRPPSSPATALRAAAIEEWGQGSSPASTLQQGGGEGQYNQWGGGTADSTLSVSEDHGHLSAPPHAVAAAGGSPRGGVSASPGSRIDPVTLARNPRNVLDDPAFEVHSTFYPSSAAAPPVGARPMSRDPCPSMPVYGDHGMPKLVVHQQGRGLDPGAVNRLTRMHYKPEGVNNTVDSPHKHKENFHLRLLSHFCADKLNDADNRPSARAHDSRIRALSNEELAKEIVL